MTFCLYPSKTEGTSPEQAYGFHRCLKGKIETQMFFNGKKVESVYFNGKKVESTGSSKLVIVVINTALWTCIGASGFYGLVITLVDIALT